MAYKSMLSDRISYFDFEKSIQKRTREKMENASNEICNKLKEEYHNELEEERIRFEEVLKELESKYIEQMTEATCDNVKDLYRVELDEIRIEFEDKAKQLQSEYIKKADEAICTECTNLLVEIADTIHTYIDEDIIHGKTNIMIRIG